MMTTINPVYQHQCLPWPASLSHPHLLHCKRSQGSKSSRRTKRCRQPSSDAAGQRWYPASWGGRLPGDRGTMPAGPPAAVPLAARASVVWLPGRLLLAARASWEAIAVSEASAWAPAAAAGGGFPWGVEKNIPRNPTGTRQMRHTPAAPLEVPGRISALQRLLLM